MSDRAGRYVNSGAYKTFEPCPLPPRNPEVHYGTRLQRLLSIADRALARLDGAASTLPNPDLFVYSFMRQEAALSSKIEGTQASLDDLFEYEAEPNLVEQNDVADIINYLDAINWSLSELENLPVSLRLLRGAHFRLLKTGRGASRNPGEFRDGQNHIGPPGCSIEEATFIPPSVPIMHEALGHWEVFLHSDAEPTLIKCALAHAQFETIHPFWDGNGRIGRMLITLLLCSDGVLERPLLYISLFFSRYKEEYYARLQAVRDEGDWESWIEFFLRGVTMTCRSALNATKNINTLREQTTLKASALGKSSNNHVAAEILFLNPVVTTARLATILDVTNQTGANIISRFVKAGILIEGKKVRRERSYVFADYIDLLNSSQNNFESNAEEL